MIKKRYFIPIPVFFIVVLLFSSNAFSTVYYVKDTGNDKLSGLSDSAAWKTIAKVNDFNFKDGDTVRFKRGSIFRYRILFSPGVDNFTIEDYGYGAKPLFDGDVAQPINIDGSSSSISNLTIRNIDISGQDWLDTKGVNLYILKVNGVTIDGVVGDGYRNFGGDKVGKNAIQIQGCTGAIVVKNCVLYNWGSIPFNNDYDAIALTVMKTVDAGATVEIFNNSFHDIQADGVQLYLSTSPTSVHNNTIYNCGENSIDNKGTQNVEYYENTFYREANFTGCFGRPAGSTCPVFTAHTSYGHNVGNITVRNNTFSGTDNVAILIKGNTDIGGTPGTKTGDGIFNGMKVYNNTFSDTKEVFQLLYNVNNVEIYDNNVISVRPGGQFYYETNNGVGVKVFDNTFTSQDDIDVGVIIEGATSKFTGNIFNIKDSNSLIMKVIWGSPEFNANYWFNSSNTTWIDFKKDFYSKEMEQDWRAIGNADFFEYQASVSNNLAPPVDFSAVSD